MTSKEALERLVKQANARKLSNEIVVNRWDYEKLLELVERDTPMEVEAWSGRCPNCGGREVRNSGFDFCPECGQRLDWSQNYKEAVERRVNNVKQI